MKFKLSKGALIAYLIIFGLAGTAGTLRALGLEEAATFVEGLIGQVDVSELSWGGLIALAGSILGLHNAEKPVR